jgi:hypothetical protein
VRDDRVVVLIVELLRDIELVTAHRQESRLQLVASLQGVQGRQGFHEVDVPKTTR